MVIISTFLIAAIICLVLAIIKLNKRLNELGGFTYNMAQKYNHTVSTLAVLITTVYQDKAKSTELTEEEKELFQEAWANINAFEILKKESRL